MDVMQFTQALSRIWVLETRLLDKTKVERMLEANSADEVLKILGETEYANIMGNIKRAADYEEILSAELKRIYHEMYDMSPSKELIDLMGIRYDYHNLKVIIKGMFLKKDLSDMFISVGRIDPFKKLFYYHSTCKGSINSIIRKGIFYFIFYSIYSFFTSFFITSTKAYN